MDRYSDNNIPSWKNGKKISNKRKRKREKVGEMKQRYLWVSASGACNQLGFIRTFLLFDDGHTFEMGFSDHHHHLGVCIVLDAQSFSFSFFLLSFLLISSECWKPNNGVTESPPSLCFCFNLWYCMVGVENTLFECLYHWMGSLSFGWFGLLLPFLAFQSAFFGYCDQSVMIVAFWFFLHNSNPSALHFMPNLLWFFYSVFVFGPPMYT